MNALFSRRIVTCALACAGFVQGLAGFGFGLVSMSLLPAILGVKQAAAVGTFYGLLVVLATFVQHCRDLSAARHRRDS